jgi:hypothetical protein
MGPVSTPVMAARAYEKISAVDRRWPRRALGWRTSHEIWQTRTPLRVNREDLRHRSSLDWEMVEILAKMERLPMRPGQWAEGIRARSRTGARSWTGALTEAVSLTGGGG